MSEKDSPEIIQVGPLDPDKKNSPIVDGPLPEEAVDIDKGAICWFNGKQYSYGACVCSGGRLLQCCGSSWGIVGSC